MSAAALRPLSIGEVLDTSFQLYRRHFRPLAGIVLICNTVPLLLDVYVESSGGKVAHPFLGFLSAILLLVLNSIATAATVFVVSEAYLGRTMSTGDALSRAQPFVGRLIVSHILYGLLVVIGMVLLIVPGFIVLVGLALTAPALVLESIPDATTALGRSWALTRGARWKLVGVFIPLVILFMLPTMGAFVLVGIVVAVAGGGATIGAVFGAAIVGILQLVFTPLVNCALTVAYYDQRVRKEGFDLEVLAGTLQPA
jgi:fumarate reductase subunit C